MSSSDLDLDIYIKVRNEKLVCVILYSEISLISTAKFGTLGNMRWTD